MPVSTRPPAEMTPQERREEFARLIARGMVRLARRLLRSPGALANDPARLPGNMELLRKNDL